MNQALKGALYAAGLLAMLTIGVYAGIQLTRPTDPAVPNNCLLIWHGPIPPSVRSWLGPASGFIGNRTYIIYECY